MVEGTGISNDEKMKANNRLLSNQAGSVLISGGGDAWKTSLYGSWNIVALVRDSESAAALSAEQAEMGYITDMFVSDCTSLISGGGGLRIEGLEITGDMNREGKAYIQALFARGVHLDLIQ